MKGAAKALTFLLVFAVVAVFGGVFVVNVIQRPLNKAAASYSAVFSNVSGLRVGNDVRLLGVRVGKVSRITLRQDRDSIATASVDFTLAQDQRLYPDSILGIRYLNLTGIRYLDISQPTTTGKPLRYGSQLSLSSTTPSFDITSVFRGLEPVFATLNTDDINHLFAGLLALVQGDSSGLSGTIESLTKALRFFDDRKQIIDKLVSNLTDVSKTINGRSEFLTPALNYLSDLADSLVDNNAELRILADSSGEVLNGADRLLAAVGLQRNQTPDLNSIVRNVVPAARSVLNVLAMTPGIIKAIDSALPSESPNSVNRNCSRGVATVPADVSVFLRGAEVVLCKR